MPCMLTAHTALKCNRSCRLPASGTHGTCCLYNGPAMRPPRSSPKTRLASRHDRPEVSVNDSEELRDKIELFLVEHPRAILAEPGKELFDLSDGSFSLSIEYGKLIWHIWNDRTNLVRQIIGIAKQKPGRLELHFQRFGKGS